MIATISGFFFPRKVSTTSEPPAHDAKDIIRRIERGRERDWRREYASLLPSVPTPTRTPGCTCDWVEERMLCMAEPTQHHTRYGEDCPDHEPPEPIP